MNGGIDHLSTSIFTSSRGNDTLTTPSATSGLPPVAEATALGSIGAAAFAFAFAVAVGAADDEAAAVAAVDCAEWTGSGVGVPWGSRHPPTPRIAALHVKRSTE